MAEPILPTVARQIVARVFSGEKRTAYEDLQLMERFGAFIDQTTKYLLEIDRLREVIARNARLEASSVGAPALAAEKMRLACIACLAASDQHAAQRKMEALKIEKVIRD